MRTILFLLGFTLTFHNADGQQQITLEEIWLEEAFEPEEASGFKFMRDGQHYTVLDSSEGYRIEKHDLATGELVEVLLDARQIADDYKINDYELAFKDRYLLLQSNKIEIYRHSFTAEYILYDLKSQRIKPIDDLSRIACAKVDPSGQRLGFVKNNDLYYQHLASGKVMRVTTDGEKNEVINGHADWVYEEEFVLTRAFEWSDHGDHLAFIRFDESEVPEFTLKLYHNEVYPEHDTYKYPKVGQTNSTVSVHIHHLINGETTQVDVGDMTDIYVPRIAWSSYSDTLCIFKLNRLQNHLQIFKTDALTGESLVMLEEKNEYYIDIHDNLTFISGGKEFIWTSESDGYNHIYRYKMDGSLVKQITDGPWEVTEVYGVDQDRGEIFYQSTELSSIDRTIHAVSIDGSTSRTIIGKNGFNGAKFSKTFDYFILEHSTLNTPPTYTVMDRKGGAVFVIEDNAELDQKLQRYGTSDVEKMTITIEGDIELNAAMIKPNNFDDSKEYPLLMYVYGGPGSQRAQDKWNQFKHYGWYQFMAQRGYVVAVVDNRGTGGKGEAFKKMTYLQLGKYETIDQINAAKYFGEKPFIDKDRIAIYGKSYGGFMSTLCILKGKDVFKAAIALAPVTHWKWYDSVYTEKYMRTEEENKDGYHENAPVNFADRLKGRYLLVHGLDDDNVHFQHTVELTRKLVAANKQFDTYFYPNLAHALDDNRSRYHLFTKITNFLDESL